MRSVVVLPAPLGPRNPKISPVGTVRSTPATASTTCLRVLKTRRSPCVSIAACATPTPLALFSLFRSSDILLPTHGNYVPPLARGVPALLHPSRAGQPPEVFRRAPPH